MGVLSAIVMGWGPNKISELYSKGFTDIAMACMMIGLARGILMVLQASNIIDTVVYYFSLPLAAFPSWFCGVAMLGMQTLLNFFIPFGSGQAAASMTIMAPLADLLGVSRGTAVLAFQFGGGLPNVLWPTAYPGILVGLAGIKVEKWWKFAIPVGLALILTQAGLIIMAVLTGFGVCPPFSSGGGPSRGRRHIQQKAALGLAYAKLRAASLFVFLLIWPAP